jgi:uncharacterized membrane protein YfcA
VALGSLIGTFCGGLLLGIVPVKVLPPLLAAILVASLIKVGDMRASRSRTRRPVREYR